MGDQRHGQGGGGRESAPPPWKCFKVSCAFVVTVKHSVDQLFMHYFRNFLSSPPGLQPWTMLEDFSSPDPEICQPVEKILRAPVSSIKHHCWNVCVLRCEFTLALRSIRSTCVVPYVLVIEQIVIVIA